MFQFRKKVALVCIAIVLTGFGWGGYQNLRVGAATDKQMTISTPIPVPKAATKSEWWAPQGDICPTFPSKESCEQFCKDEPGGGCCLQYSYPPNGPARCVKRTTTCTKRTGSASPAC
jgi:hypothetical protein